MRPPPDPPDLLSDIKVQCGREAHDFVRCINPSQTRCCVMATPDILLIAAAALSTVVIWLGVEVQGQIVAALAKS
ncbi:MAG: hypothetical protein MZV49_02320 [Rhodopseudomonas palustris]|nr:hypothetical protein [Rhodopseudomonas palustris]